MIGRQTSLINVTAIACAQFLFLSNAYAQSYCDDIQFLVNAATTRFESIRGMLRNTRSQTKFFRTNFILADADRCAIKENSKKSAYYCYWEYRSQTQAERKFTQLERVIENCRSDILLASDFEYSDERGIKYKLEESYLIEITADIGFQDEYDTVIRFIALK